MTDRIAILAYGSLIAEPGDEIADAIDYRLKRGIITPFHVEFARSSSSRGGAPTLVPVEGYGAAVPGQLMVLRRDVSERAARDMVWRRETRRKGSTPDDVEAENSGPNQVRIRKLRDFRGIGLVLYTNLAPNIRPLTAQRLAELALGSARSPYVPEGRDGISYLIGAQRNGIRTPLSAEYEAEIKRQAHANSLSAALGRMRAERENAARLTGGLPQ